MCVCMRCRAQRVIWLEASRHGRDVLRDQVFTQAAKRPHFSLSPSRVPLFPLSLSLSLSLSSLSSLSLPLFSSDPAQRSLGFSSQDSTSSSFCVHLLPFTLLFLFLFLWRFTSPLFAPFQLPLLILP